MKQILRLFHIHWHNIECGMTSKSGTTWDGRNWIGWSTIWRCRCGHEKLKEM